MRAQAPSPVAAERSARAPLPTISALDRARALELAASPARAASETMRSVVKYVHT